MSRTLFPKKIYEVHYKNLIKCLIKPSFMEQAEQSIKTFTIAFFQNLKATIEEKDGMLIVKNVPKDFETFVGKASPYYFVFSQNASCPIHDNVEVLTKGNYLLKAMTTYLDNKGQTTLLKLDFDFKQEDIEKNFSFGNCTIYKLSKKEENNYLFRFTYQTTFQYLNEKETVINNIFVKDNFIIDFDLDRFPVVEGKKQDADSAKIKEAYNLSKENLKTLLVDKTKEIASLVSDKLEKEITRIKAHYVNQINEISQESENLEKQLRELEAGNTNGDLANIPQRINKIKEHIQSLKKADKKEKLLQEQEFFIKDETRKHSLGIDNKLINTTIIYYPTIFLNLFLKNSDAARQIDLLYSPIQNKLTQIDCEICKNKINHIFLCSSGHLTCKTCIHKCLDCGKEYCPICLDRNCSYCGKRICRKCAIKCQKCNNYFCSTHIKANLCVGCSKRCQSCNNYFKPEQMKKCSCNKEYCPSCARSNILLVNSRTLCTSCSKKCPACLQVRPLSDFAKCPGCNPEVCNFLSKCTSCRKQLCFKLKKR